MADTDLERLEARLADVERRQLDLLMALKPARSGGRDWDAYAAVIATFIGVIALAVAAYTSYLQRRQLQAQVWPRLSLYNSNINMKLFLDNQGTGPARLTAVRVTVDGRPMANWSDARRAFGFGEQPMLIFSSISGRVLPAGQNLEFAWARDDEVSRKKFLDMIQGNGHGFGITICYCSVLDDCWVERYGQQPDVDPARKNECPVRASEQFHN
jgi:hypothetical protein